MCACDHVFQGAIAVAIALLFLRAAAFGAAAVSSELEKSIQRQAASTEERLSELRARIDLHATNNAEALLPVAQALQELKQHVDRSAHGSSARRSRS